MFRNGKRNPDGEKVVPGGKAYIVTKPFKDIKEGFVFRICVDGEYQMFYPDGTTKAWLRISAKSIEGETETFSEIRSNLQVSKAP